MNVFATMSKRNIILAVLSVALAVVTNLTIQKIAELNLKPVGEKCFAGDYVGIVPFEPWLGGSFVCIMNTLFYSLVGTPEGIFAWGSLMATYFPVAILLVVEASREGVKGVLKYPVFILLISQYLAVSVAFPLVWVPMYLLWGRGTTHGFGPSHANFTDIAGLFFFGVSVALFALDNQSYAWTFTASLIGGPFMVIPYVFLALLKLPVSSDPVVSSKLIVVTYHGASLASFMVWIFTVSILVLKYQDPSVVLKAIWANASYSVQIINLDWFVWFLSILLVVANENPMDAVKAVVMMPIVGPGTALAYILAHQEQNRAKKLEKKAD